MKKTTIIFSFIMILILAGCGFLDSSQEVILKGTSWKLVSYDGKFPIEGREITAIFTGAEISGSAGCNHYFGSYKVKGDEITIEGLGWTEMACLDPEGIMEQEVIVMMMFSRAEKINRRNGTLEIQTSLGEILLFEMTSSD